MGFKEGTDINKIAHIINLLPVHNQIQLATTQTIRGSNPSEGMIFCTHPD
jgi:hypothetical protein